MQQKLVLEDFICAIEARKRRESPRQHGLGRACVQPGQNPAKRRVQCAQDEVATAESGKKRAPRSQAAEERFQIDDVVCFRSEPDRAVQGGLQIGQRVPKFGLGLGGCGIVIEKTCLARRTGADKRGRVQIKSDRVGEDRFGRGEIVCRGECKQLRILREELSRG